MTPPTMMSFQEPTLPLPVFLFGFAFALLFVFGVVVPFEGILVRYRANYAPRGLRLTEEGVEGQHGPDHSVNSLWGMFKRVRGLEGTEGLYKNIS